MYSIAQQWLKNLHFRFSTSTFGGGASKQRRDNVEHGCTIIHLPLSKSGSKF